MNAGQKTTEISQNNVGTTDIQIFLTTLWVSLQMYINFFN